MPMEVCLDESGIHAGAKRCVVAGYAGGRQKIEALEDQWVCTLKRFNVPLEVGFHAKTFFARRGVHKGWSDAQAKDFITAMADSIHANELKAIGGGLSYSRFNALPENMRRWLTGGRFDEQRGRWLSSGAPSKPYFFGFHQAVVTSCKFAKSGVAVDFIMDRQENFSGLALETWNYFKTESRMHAQQHLGDISFYSRFERVSLQASDLLAFSMYHAEEYREECEKPLIRYAIHQLVKQNIHVQNLDKYIDHLLPVYPKQLREQDEEQSRISEISGRH